jgi:hypothetical protein
VWAPDGRSLFVMRGTGATVRGEPLEANQWFELARVPAEGGSATVIAEMTSMVRPNIGPEGRVYFPQASAAGGDLRIAVSRGETPQRFIALRSLDQSGADARAHIAFPFATDIAPSPDGRWVAFREGENIYLTAFPTERSAQPPFIDRTDGSGQTKRLTFTGGYHPRWRNATTLEFANGSQYLVYDAVRGRLDTVRVPFRIPSAPPGGTIALVNARLVTLDRKRVIQRGTLLVRGRRIVCVGPSAPAVGACDTRGASRVLDLSGKTIIPGFIDVHAHHTESIDGPFQQHRANSARYLAWGVTTVNDPAAVSLAAFPLADLVDAERIVGPRSFSAGHSLGPGPNGGNYEEIERYQDADDHVARLAAWGALSIKDFLESRRDQRQMISVAAIKYGRSVTAEGADLLYNVSLVMDGHTGWEHPLNYVPIYADAAKFFGLAGATYSPTLTVGGTGAWSLEYWLAHNDLWRDAKDRRFVPWRQLLRTRNYVQRPMSEYSFPILLEGVADVVRAGGNAAIGGHGEYIGRGSHWEVWNYAMTLSPMEALEMASMGGARVLGIDQDIGSLTVGKLADFMVLDANPLANIYGTPPWMNEAVFTGGSKPESDRDRPPVKNPPRR